MFDDSNLKNKGFTIIEIIITVFLLAIAVVGIFSAFSLMVILTSNTADQLTSAYLAQEGMEIIRNIRDNNWLGMEVDPTVVSWDEGLTDCEHPAGCEVDYRTITSGQYPVYPASDRFFKIDPNVGFYNYETGTDTKFKRKITIECLPNNNCTTEHIMKVIVEVSWTQKPNILNPSGASGIIQVEDILYNWYIDEVQNDQQ
jgi:hypothetical protein